MAGKSTFLSNKLLDYQFGGTVYALPANFYIELYTAAPTDAGGGTPVGAGGAYARAAVTNDAANFPNAVGGSKSNAAAITFAQATAPWGTVVAFGIFDALVGGNLLYWALLTTPITIPTGGTFSFATGQLVITED